MTCRELMIYILKNGLLDEQVFDEGGHLVGFISEDEAAAKFGVGASTIRAWVNMGKLKGLNLNCMVYVPYNAKNPKEEGLL